MNDIDEQIRRALSEEENQLLGNDDEALIHYLKALDYAKENDSKNTRFVQADFLDLPMLERYLNK